MNGFHCLFLNLAMTGMFRLEVRGERFPADSQTCLPADLLKTSTLGNLTQWSKSWGSLWSGTSRQRLYCKLLDGRWIPVLLVYGGLRVFQGRCYHRPSIYEGLLKDETTLSHWWWIYAYCRSSFLRLLASGILNLLSSVNHSWDAIGWVCMFVRTDHWWLF